MTNRLTAGAATLRFDPANGGTLAVMLDGQELLAPAPALNLVLDGKSISGWRVVAAMVGEALVLRGPVDAAVVAELTISPLADRGCFEFTLRLTNIGTAPVRVSTADAFAGRLAKADWQGLSFTSKWGEEYEPEHFGLDVSREIEVRTGRSSLGQCPWLGATSGFGALAVAPVWSGNWHIGIAPGSDGVGLTAGISPWKFWHDLKPGASFEAPAVLVAFGADLDAATLALTRAVGARLPRSAASEALPLEWNHWWPYEDKEISEAVFLDNAAIATELGFEVSTLDAGWFGAADADTFWWDIRGDFAEENRARFPGGIAGLADAVRQRGQRFGIWMEIEAVGLKAAVRRAKPEIMARRDDDPPEAPLDTEDPGFLGYVCLGSEAGRAHVRQLLETLVKKTRCEWIKIDFNLDPKAGCSCADHGHGAGDGLYAHYRGLYALYDAFRADHPEIILEACASGGLRVDAGLLRHVHCAFLSDPDWLPHHLAVVHGTSHLLPPAAMLHWPMSEWRGKHPQQTLSLRDPDLTEEMFDAIIRSGFLHRFGLSWRLPDLPQKWRQRLKAQLRLYAEEVAPLVRNGDLLRLTPAPLRSGGGERQPRFQLSSGDRHLLLGFSLGPQQEALGIRPAPAGLAIVPRGLEAGRRYRLRELAPEGAAPVVRSGAEWMRDGVPVGTASYAGVLEAV
jgi:alpha-galactosidase